MVTPLNPKFKGYFLACWMLPLDDKSPRRKKFFCFICLFPSTSIQCCFFPTLLSLTLILCFSATDLGLALYVDSSGSLHPGRTYSWRGPVCNELTAQ